MSSPKPYPIQPEKLREVCDRLQQELLDDPNVVGVGIGPNIVKGQRKGMVVQITVRVLPKTKKEMETLGTRPMPKEMDGVPIELIEATLDRPDAPPTGERGGRQEDPLVGGTSTTVLSNFHSFPTGYGTLGGICFDETTGNTMAISNAHVWGEETGRTVIQPWLPIDEYVEGAVKLIACGSLVSYLADWTAPSPLTGILAAGAAGAWAATAALDLEDPSRWGQVQTPVGNTVATQAERITIKATVPENPMPGYPYVTPTVWNYTRLTTETDKTAVREEENQNVHFALKKVVTDKQQYGAGTRVRICADILGFRAQRARDYFVVARCFPLSDPDRVVTRVLVPGECDIKRPDEWECFKHFPRVWLKEQQSFPLHFGVFEFLGNGLPQVKQISVDNQQGAQIVLGIPSQGGLSVNVLPTSRVRVDVSHTAKPVTVYARDPIGRVIDKKTSGPGQSQRETLELTGGLIQSLSIFGGGGEGWVHGMCVDRPDLPTENLPDIIRTFSFIGNIDLSLQEGVDRWGIIVTVQTVDNSPPDTPPIEAAQNIGGLMTAPVTAQLAGCVTVMLLDHVFDVI